MIRIRGTGEIRDESLNLISISETQTAKEMNYSQRCSDALIKLCTCSTISVYSAKGLLHNDNEASYDLKQKWVWF